MLFVDITGCLDMIYRCFVWQHGLKQSESESDNPTEGVVWKARDLWSAPVERSSHGLQARKSNRLCSLRQGLAAGILQSAAAALPPSGSVSSSMAAPSPHHRVGCHGMLGASAHP